MQSAQGIYTINTGNNFCYDNSAVEKSLTSVVLPTMPANTEITNEKPKKRKLFRFPKSRKGKLALLLDLAIFLIVVVLIVLVEFGILPHHQSGFYCNDPKISFKYEGDTVSMGLLLSFVYFGPLLMLILVELRNNDQNISEASKKTWQWYKQFLLGITVNLLIIEVTKVIIGEPRPHFLDSCRPDTAVNCTAGAFIPHYTCTNKNLRTWLVLDSSKSFLSGHAALSVFSAAFTIWYLQRCLPGLACRLLKPLLQTLLFAACLVCSLSRISDHRHHWWDVLAGSILGFACALYTIVVFCQNFKRASLTKPRPSHSTCTLLTDTTNKHATSVVL